MTLIERVHHYAWPPLNEEILAGYLRIKPEPGFCDLRIYEHEGKTIVVFTDPIAEDGDWKNKGMSLTNSVEQVATAIRREKGYNPDIWVEYSPARIIDPSAMQKHEERGTPVRFESAEIVSFVTFRDDGEGYSHPTWKHVKRSDLTEILGEELPEWHREQGHRFLPEE